MNPKTNALVFVFLIATVILALAALDYTSMHLQYDRPEWLFHYWLAQVLTVCTLGFAFAYMVRLSGESVKASFATFATATLLYAGGLLDLFYSIFATLRGEIYNFTPWHWATKLGYTNWGWTEELVFFAVCVGAICLIWRWAVKR